MQLGINMKLLNQPVLVVSVNVLSGVLDCPEQQIALRK